MANPAGHDEERRPGARRGNGEVDAVRSGDELNLLLHQSPPRTANSRCASPTPFSSCSPRSSKDTPADVRARPRTGSDTSTSPGAEAAAIRAARVTAPP